MATRRAPALRRLESGSRSDDDGPMAVLETAKRRQRRSNMRHGHGGYMHLLVEACRASISSLTCSVKVVLQGCLCGGMPKARTLLGRS